MNTKPVPYPMTVVIMGLGYVGATAAACLVSQGHKVVGVDVNTQKVAELDRGIAPIVEPDVPELLAQGAAEGLLSASTSVPALDEVDVVIVCVGTPSAVDGSHNMSYIAESARQIAASAAQSSGSVTVAFRSTFRPGTMESLIEPIFREALGDSLADRVELVYNPEFLRESTAVKDYFQPPKIVLGTAEGARSATMHRLHVGIDAPTFEVGYREAELTKFVDNSWHAVKVAFANEIGRVSSAYGVDVSKVHDIFVADTKLNISSYYMRPGGPFGGSCLPKDVRAMEYLARSADVDVSLLHSLLPSNEAHKAFQTDRVLAAAPPNARILVIGLAFKAGTDDMRESPHVTLVADLIRAGHDVSVFDPVVRTSSLIGQNLGQVMTEVPTLRELLKSEEQVRSDSYDLVVINTRQDVELDLGDTPVIDLRTIGLPR